MISFKKNKSIVLYLLGLVTFGLIIFLFVYNYESTSIVNTQTSLSSRDQSFSTLNQPCKLSRHCDSSLYCRQGHCRPRSQTQLEVGETCSNYGNLDQCRSGICRNSKCQPSIHVGAQNFSETDSPQLCRSKMLKNRACFPSKIFPAFHNEACDFPGDCVSGICQHRVCQPRSGSISCIAVGEPGNESQCCSGYSRNGICRGTFSDCILKGDCQREAGNICALVNSPCENRNECCSHNCSPEKNCMPNFDELPTACTSEKQCSPGYICHPKKMICLIFE